MKINKSILGIVLILFVSGAFAQEAVIRELTGTVELQHPGSAEWEKASQGQTILQRTIVSTGFKSSALIGIGDSLISVRPLTRLTLTELSARTETETINTNLIAGRVRVDVKAPAGTRSSFGVQSPIATASVRGTVFEMGIYELRVLEGTVEYWDSSASAILVDAVGYSFIDERTGRAVYPMATLNSVLNPGLPIASDSFNSFKVEAAHGSDLFRITTKTGYK